MSLSCPNEECGRKFADHQTLIEHVTRRHPEALSKLEDSLSKTIMFNHKKKEEDLSKLPQIVRRPSRSKEKSENVSVKGLPAKKVITAAELVSNTRIQLQGIGSLEHRASQKSDKAIKILQRPSLTFQGTPKNEIKKNIMPIRRPQSKQKSSGSEGKPLDRTVTTAAVGYESTTEESILGTPHAAGNVQIKGQKNVIRTSSKEKQKLVMPTAIFPRRLSEKQPNPKVERSELGKTMGSETTQWQVPPKPVQQKSHKRLTLKQNKKQQKAQSNTNQQLPSQVAESKVFILKQQTEHFTPSFTCIQYLALNGVGLVSMDISSLQVLQQLSATHNNLRNMDFICYEGNQYLTTVHLDNNQIQKLVLTDNLRTLTLAFNKVAQLGEVCQQLCLSRLQQLDLSFNPVRNMYNYKLQVMLKGKDLKKIDGMKITKHDIDMAVEYKTMCRQEVQVVNRSVAPYYQRFKQKIQQDYSYVFADKLSEEEYNKMRKQQQQLKSKSEELMKLISIIRRENEVLEEELHSLESGEIESASQKRQFQALQSEMDVLETLNFLKFADDSELQTLIKAAQSQLKHS